MHPIFSAIYPEDIYKGFIPLPESITGWGGTKSIFAGLIQQVRPKIIIEVGTWKGQSAITMAEACKTLKLDSVIICLDTWLGSPELHFKCAQELRRVNGYPTIYYQFLSNVVHRGFQQTILPLAATSLTGARVLRDLGVKAELIYIDADHQYEAVSADLEAFWPLLAKGGILFGHDYSIGSVKKAVVEFCNRTGLTHKSQSGFWIIDEPSFIEGLGHKLK
jgi:hypothetical protein